MEFRTFLFSWAATLAATIAFSVLWHVVLFEEVWLALGVYNRMDDPIYGFGIAAWVLESGAFVALFRSSKRARQSIGHALIFSVLVGAVVSASTLFGTAAKVEISNLSIWFALQGTFVLSHFLLLGFIAWFVSIKEMKDRA